MIYLDNAATSFPKPACVINEMMLSQRDYGANPGRGGHKLTMKAGEKVFQTRQALSEMFSCQSERVVFTANCTHSLNMAIKGSVRKGDHVIISSLEHNSVLRPVQCLFEKNEITYDIAKVNPLSDDETVSNFMNLIKENTTLIVCTYVSNVFGTVLPVKRIGELCRRKKIRFIVDAAQAAGSFEINMKEMCIDILCLPCHKGLFGPMGTGAMLLSDEADPESFCEGGTGSFSLEISQPDVLPDKFESGTANLPGIAGTHEGIKFIKRLGGEAAVHQKEMNLANTLTEDLSVIKGIKVYSHMQGAVKSPVVAFNLRDIHSEQVGTALDRHGIAVRAGYHCSYLAHNMYETDETGVVRVSPGVFNTKKDIKTLAFFINRFTTDRKI